MRRGDGGEALVVGPRETLPSKRAAGIDHDAVARARRLAAALGELHAVVLTGGVGQHSAELRAAALGGSCEAGPDPDRGWTVTAVLPRAGVGA